MTEIYLIRHIQAEGNLYRAMQGQWDGGVTELGLKQVDALAERFREIPVDALYASDLTRACVTASAIQKTHPLPLRTDVRLREIDLGPWETRFFGDLKHEEPESIDCFIHAPYRWRLDGAETYAEVGERAFAALEEIARENEGKTVAVVSHGVTIRCLLIRALGSEAVGGQLIGGNTAVSHLLYDNGVFTADYLNDAAHLAALNVPVWEKTPDLRGEPLDPRREAEYYSACYADAWRAAHGSLKGFSPEPYLRGAIDHHRADPGAVLKIYDGDTPAGLIDMDPLRGAQLGAGWLSLLYLAPAYRDRGCGIQLLGRVLMHYQALGRTALRLHVAEENRNALAFYRRWGFEELSHESNALGRLLLMEKKLGGNGHV